MGDHFRIFTLAITFPEPGENTNNFHISLRPENFIDLEKFVTIETLAEINQIMVDHLLLQTLIEGSPGILQQRNQIIGRMTPDSILKIQQANPGNPLALGQPHQVVSMVIPKRQAWCLPANAFKQRLPNGPQFSPPNLILDIKKRR